MSRLGWIGTWTSGSGLSRPNCVDRDAGAMSAISGSWEISMYNQSADRENYGIWSWEFMLSDRANQTSDRENHASDRANHVIWSWESCYLIVRIMCVGHLNVRVRCTKHLIERDGCRFDIWTWGRLTANLGIWTWERHLCQHTRTHTHTTYRYD